MFFFDGELAQEATATKTYSGGKECDENSIGREQDEAHNFRGEVGTLHFVEIAHGSLAITHTVLAKVFRVLPMSELFPLIAYGKEAYDNWPELQECIYFKELVESGIIERLFLVVNPKFAAGPGARPGEKIFVKKAAKHTVEICCQVEKVLPRTRTYHNAPAKDTFLVIRGVLAFVPLLQSLSDSPPPFPADLVYPS